MSFALKASHLEVEGVISFEATRCHECGRWWGCEDKYSDATCPRCAKQKLDAHEVEIEALRRSAIGMKAAFGRVRKRR